VAVLIEAVIRAVIPDLVLLPRLHRVEVESDCVAGVRRHLAVAPLQIRAAYSVLSLVFLAYTLATTGRLPARLTRRQLLAALESFSRRWPVSIQAYERLSRALCLLNYFDHPRVLAGLGALGIAEHQAAFRSQRASGLQVEL